MLPPPEGYHNIIPENTEGYGGEKPPANCIKGIDWLHYQSVPLVLNATIVTQNNPMIRLGLEPKPLLFKRSGDIRLNPQSYYRISVDFFICCYVTFFM